MKTNEQKSPFCFNNHAKQKGSDLKSVGKNLVCDETKLNGIE